MNNTNKRNHVSLKDIASRLGVSVSTVSRALNDSCEIGGEMREIVKALAKELNYRPNPFAKSLLKDSPRIIGIIVPDIVAHFYASIISSIEEVALQNGYFVIITTSYESYERERKNVDNLISMRVEGIIACLSEETTDYTHFEELSRMNIPVVFFDRVCLTEIFSSVVADGDVSAYGATQHLIETGSKRIAFIGGGNHLGIVKMRKHGYLQALRDNRIPIERELVICHKLGYKDGIEATNTLLSLKQRPDAILAMNDVMAFAAMEAIKAHGLKIPQDVALIGYSDEQHANYVEPKLTSVTHQTHKMGEVACRLLLEQITSGRSSRQVRVATKMIIRGSSDKRKTAPLF